MSVETVGEGPGSCPAQPLHNSELMRPDRTAAPAVAPRNTRAPAQPDGARGTALIAALCLALAATGCTGVPVPATEKDPSAQGTLSGAVRGPGGVAPPAGRQVEAVDVETGRRYATETNTVGGFSLLLPPGRYRVEVALTSGETVVESPGIVTVEPSELVDEQDVTLGGAGVVDGDG